jgi:ElaB/YqjD/DUF883 family membrane-anchored ribosome-binding protein
MIDRMQGGAESALPPQVGQFRETALDLAAGARERLSEGTDLVRNYVIRNPARALGIALGMGVLLGWLIKRR